MDWRILLSSILPWFLSTNLSQIFLLGFSQTCVGSPMPVLQTSSMQGSLDIQKLTNFYTGCQSNLFQSSVGDFRDAVGTPPLISWQLHQTICAPLKDVKFVGQLKIWDEGMTGPYLIRDSQIEIFQENNQVGSWILKEFNALNQKYLLYHLVDGTPERTDQALVWKSTESPQDEDSPWGSIHRLVWQQVAQQPDQILLITELQQCEKKQNLGEGTSNDIWTLDESKCRPSLGVPYRLKKMGN